VVYHDARKKLTDSNTFRLLYRQTPCFRQTLEISFIFVREHGVHAGPKDYFVVVVVVVICG
jgi:hypothetical protein